MANKRSADNTAITTIRLDRRTLAAFKEQLSGEPMNQRICSWIADFTESRIDPGDGSLRRLTPAGEEQLANLFAARVAHHLQSNNAWATEIIRAGQLQYPADSLLRDRMSHYTGSKQRAAEIVTEHVAARLEFLLSNGRKEICLLVDAGSAALYTLQAMWRHLADIDGKYSGVKIRIVTVNLAVSDSFIEQCHSGRFNSSSALSCELLAGVIQHRYACVTGPTTAANLETFRADKKKRGFYCIGLLSGNYIRLSDTRPAYPIALVRGWGQHPAKEALAAAADEILLLGSTGKIIRANNADANDAILGKSRKKLTADQNYKDVRVPKAAVIVKLASTLRQNPRSILWKHSELICAALAQRPDDDKPTDTTMLRHLLDWYDDDVKDLSPGDQVRVEFPHVFPEMKSVLQRYFAIDSQMLALPHEFWAKLASELPPAGVDPGAKFENGGLETEFGLSHGVRQTGSRRAVGKAPFLRKT